MNATMNEPTTSQPFVGRTELTERLGISMPTLHRLIVSGKFPPAHINVGKIRRWDWERIREWLALGGLSGGGSVCV